MSKVKSNVQVERGLTLVESLISVAILGMAIVAAISALSTGSIAVGKLDEEVTAQSLARTQLEEIKAATYAPSYSVVSQSGYNISVGVDPFAANIQKITVTIFRNGLSLLVVEDYKVNR